MSNGMLIVRYIASREKRVTTLSMGGETSVLEKNFRKRMLPKKPEYHKSYDFLLLFIVV